MGYFLFLSTISGLIFAPCLHFTQISPSNGEDAPKILTTVTTTISIFQPNKLWPWPRLFTRLSYFYQSYFLKEMWEFVHLFCVSVTRKGFTSNFWPAVIKIFYKFFNLVRPFFCCFFNIYYLRLKSGIFFESHFLLVLHSFSSLHNKTQRSEVRLPRTWKAFFTESRIYHLTHLLDGRTYLRQKSLLSVLHY